MKHHYKAHNVCHAAYIRNTCFSTQAGCEVTRDFFIAQRCTQPVGGGFDVERGVCIGKVGVWHHTDTTPTTHPPPSVISENRTVSQPSWILG